MYVLGRTTTVLLYVDADGSLRHSLVSHPSLKGGYSHAAINNDGARREPVRVPNLRSVSYDAQIPTTFTESETPYLLRELAAAEACNNRGS